MQNLLSASGTDRAKSWENRTDGASGIVPPFLEPGLWGSWLGRWWPLDWTIFIIRSTGWERLSEGGRVLTFWSSAHTPNGASQTGAQALPCCAPIAAMLGQHSGAIVRKEVFQSWPGSKEHLAPPPIGGAGECDPEQANPSLGQQCPKTQQDS